MQHIPGYEPGRDNPVADEALANISKMFGGHIPNYDKVLANSSATQLAAEQAEGCRA